MTLIEILVVLVILAILVGLAVPGYGWALDLSRQKGCLSNLRQIGLSLEAYRQDNNGNFPDMRAMRTDKSVDVPVLDTVLLPYIQDPNIFHCPADRGSVWAASGCSYWWYEAVTLKPDGSHNYQEIESFFLGTRELSKIPLVLDKEGFHPVRVKINAYFADGHAAPLVEPNPQAP